MNKPLKMFLVATLAVCFAIAAALLVGCETAQTEYTVTVTCPDDSVLSNARVQLLNENGSVAAESALTNGNATFNLKTANYTAIVVGLPANYTADSQNLSSTVTTCTIAIKRVYTVSVAYPEINDVFGRLVHQAGAAQGVTVSLYEGKLEDDRGSALDGKTPAATKTTDSDGKATFQLDGDLYTIVLSDYTPGLEINYADGSLVNTVDKNSPAYDVTFKTPRFVPGSSDKSPLTLNLGENSIPVTENVLLGLDTNAVTYSFTPQKTGNYTFAVTGCGRVSEMNGLFEVKGDDETVVSLQADTTYMLWLGVSKVPVTTYTVTITEGGELDEDTMVPEFDTLVGSHSVEIVAGTKNAPDLNEDVISVWYKYTATEDATYKLSDSTKTLWCMICPGEQSKTVVGRVDFNGNETGDGTLEF